MIEILHKLGLAVITGAFGVGFLYYANIQRQKQAILETELSASDLYNGATGAFTGTVTARSDDRIDPQLSDTPALFLHQRWDFF